MLLRPIKCHILYKMFLIIRVSLVMRIHRLRTIQIPSFFHYEISRLLLLVYSTRFDNTGKWDLSNMYNNKLQILIPMIAETSRFLTNFLKLGGSRGSYAKYILLNASDNWGRCATRTTSASCTASGGKHIKLF